MENITVKIEKVPCSKCNCTKTIVEYQEDKKTAILDCGHIVTWNSNMQIWEN